MTHVTRIKRDRCCGGKNLNFKAEKEVLTITNHRGLYDGKTNFIPQIEMLNTFVSGLIEHLAMCRHNNSIT